MAGQKKPRKQVVVLHKCKHFIVASDPEIQREIEETIREAAKLQAASRKAFRLELAKA